MVDVILHGMHAGSGAEEWLMPVLLATGIGAALLGRWVASWRRRGPSDHDEPI